MKRKLEPVQNWIPTLYSEHDLGRLIGTGSKTNEADFKSYLDLELELL